MAVTRLKRKERKNKSRAKARISRIQQLTETPVIKNVDVEAIKKEFAANKSKGKKTETAKADKVEAKAADAELIDLKEKGEIAPTPDTPAEEAEKDQDVESK